MLNTLSLSLMAASLLWLGGCMDHPMHQGNVLTDSDALLVQEGDSRYRVETMLGSPAIEDSLNPNHVIYIEDVLEPATDTAYTRRIEIFYSDTLQVTQVIIHGFETPRDKPAAAE